MFVEIGFLHLLALVLVYSFCQIGVEVFKDWHSRKEMRKYLDEARRLNDEIVSKTPIRRVQ